MVQKLCGSIGVELPFQPAERELKEMARIQVSRSTINRVCLELGREAQEFQKELHLPENFGEPQKVVIEMDGGRVNTDQGWREPRLARIEASNKNGRKAVFVLTAIIGAEEFWTKLVAALKQLGLDACTQMAFIGDGAKWILIEAAKRFPQAL
ncbi:MAG: hypothetical protein HY716_05685 [Planctomycetes bacterium]|nr:hypothetical protein [Planctomycetota bacterium]